MTESTLVLPRIDQVVGYLRKRHWKQTTTLDGDMLVLTGREDAAGKPIRIALPKSDEYEDAPRAIRKALSLLSTIEKRPILDVATAVAHPNSDVIRKRLFGTRQGNGSIPMDLASEVITSLFNLIADAATQEDRVRVYFDRKTKTAKEYAKNCRFGHTFQGSFGFTVECPIPLNTQGDFTAEDCSVDAPVPPFERRVIERLAHGFQDLASAVEQNSVQPLIQNIERGFNANLCQDIADLAECLDDIMMEYAIVWSTEWRPRAAVETFTPVRIDRQAIDLLKSASANLRSVVGELRQQTIIGLVIDLHSVTPPSDEDEEDEVVIDDRTVVILRDADRGRSMRVQVTLPADQYQQACNAHRDGKKVSVEGVPEKRTRTGPWRLVEPANFRVVEETIS